VIADTYVYAVSKPSTSAYGGPVTTRRLVTTSELARAIGLSGRTIQRYRTEGIITPVVVSKGGHARWDVEQVIEDLKALQRGER